MDYPVTIITYLFDFFIIMTFLNRVLDERKDWISSWVFYGSFILMEVILFANEIFVQGLSDELSLYINTAISFITTLALCFFYTGSFKHKFFTSLSFQVLVLLSETIFTLLIKLLNPNLFRYDIANLNMYLNLGTKCIQFLMCLIYSHIWNRKIHKFPTEYNIMLYTTPVISLMIMLLVPSKDLSKATDDSFYLLLFFSLILLNMVNYLLLKKVLHAAQVNAKYEQMQQQVQFQKEKYKQLNAAYRNTRSVVHDTKKHYFAVQKLIENKEYDKLVGYFYNAVNTLESTYAKINTGNLVIDSFVTNYMNVAKNEGIRFQSMINIDVNQIPVSDYDMSILLGNLLDNCLQACRKNSTADNYIKIQITTDHQGTFTIHTTNTYDKEASASLKNYSQLYHGYGLENIKQITEKYHGMFRSIKEDYFDAYIIIPIIE